jgi:hypothetical protein
VPLLNQILAIEKGSKNRAEQGLTKAYQLLQKADLLEGLEKTYQPKDEEGDQLPPDSKRLQVRAPEVIKSVSQDLLGYLDITLTKDAANCTAKADVVVDGQVIANDVPVTTLLFLEKKLADLHTFFSKLPVLNPAYDWRSDDARDCYVTEPRQTARTNKIEEPVMLAAATEKHPAQVQLRAKDVLVGYWTTVNLSGALPASRVNELKARVEKLQDAVKAAREAANSCNVEHQHIGEKIFGYLLAE